LDLYVMTPLPSWIDPEAWEEYETMRRRIKKPMSARVIRQKLALLQRFKDAGHDVNAVIDAATNGHWLDFYEPRTVEISVKAISGRVSGEFARYEAERGREPVDSAKRRAAIELAKAAIKRVA
jgi:hypothetical protein